VGEGCMCGCGEGYAPKATQHLSRGSHSEVVVRPPTCSYTACMLWMMKNTRASTARCWFSHSTEKVFSGFTNT
jgi:hypothetical protein